MRGGYHHGDRVVRPPVNRGRKIPEEVAKHCAKCVFRGEKGMNLCNYAFLTGQLRGCPMGPGCTRRVVGPKAKVRALSVDFRLVSPPIGEGGEAYE